MQDGNIHCHIDNLSRRSGKNGERIAVATAAYNAGQRLWSELEQRFVDFGIREDVVFAQLVQPDSAPDWARDRTTLWNRVDLTAKRKDARLAKTIEGALARDIPADQRQAFLLEFVAPFVALGCVADVAIHEDGTDHNPHVHILLTTRQLSADGFAAKLAALEQRQFVKQVRRQWADLTNQYLAKAGSTLRVDHRSYKARGIEAVPTVHRGPDRLERRTKREHARRVRQGQREEHTMAKPDVYVRRQYPHLTARETWPPEPEASPDMTRQERDEHHRYWQDQKINQLEQQALAEPEQVSASKAEQPWYQQALTKARSESVYGLPVPDPEQDAERAEYERDLANQALQEPLQTEEHVLLNLLQSSDPRTQEQVETLIHSRRIAARRSQDEQQLIGQLKQRMEPQQAAALETYLRQSEMEQPNRQHDEAQERYDAEVMRRAKAMVRNQAEHEALSAMRDAPPEAQRFIEDFILQERMQVIRERDRAAKLAQIQPEMRRKLEALRHDRDEADRDLPVPGPHGELLTQRELDRAQERMLDEHLREEPDHDEPER